MFYVLSFGSWYDWPVVGKYNSVEDFPKEIDDEPITSYYGPFETEQQAKDVQQRVIENIFNMENYEFECR